MNAQGELLARAESFVEQTLLVNLNGTAQIAPPVSDLASVYSALVLGVRDYVTKTASKAQYLGSPAA